MEKIFYTNKDNYATSEEAVTYILKTYFQIKDVAIHRNKNGKPYIFDMLSPQNPPLFFSVSHTKGTLFIIFSDKNIGIDGETKDREINFAPIVKKFPKSEQEEIVTTLDFLQHWTAKESTIKWLGGTIAKDLYYLSFYQQQIFHQEKALPVKITFVEFKNTILAICSEKQVANPTFIAFP